MHAILVHDGFSNWVTYNCIVQRTEERQNKEKKSERRKRTKLNQT
jgi:hypothetical protein